MYLSTSPALASRPVFLPAAAKPHCLSSFSAASIEPPSSMARLQSMMPAPVRSRSSLICSVDAGMFVLTRLRLRLRVFVLVHVELVHQEVLFGHHRHVGWHG